MTLLILTLLSACQGNPAPTPSSEASVTESSDTTGEAAVNIEDGEIEVSGKDGTISVGEGGIQIAGGAGSITVGSGGITVSGGNNMEETLMEGVIAVYSSNGSVNIRVESNGSETAVAHHIALSQIVQVEEGQTYDEMLAITAKEPLFYIGKTEALEEGFGYYFVDDGNVWMVLFESKVVTSVFPVGQHTGIVISASGSTQGGAQGPSSGGASGSSSTAKVEVEEDGDVTVHGGGASVVAGGDGGTKITGGGVEIETDGGNVDIKIPGFN